MSGPAISDEMARAFNRAFNEAYDRLGDDEPYEATRAGLAAALVASGWRPEADVLREAAEEIRGADSFNYDDEDPEDWQAIVAAHLEMRADIRERYPATALEPVGALPVADGSEAELIRWEHPDAHRPYWNPDDSLTHEPRRGPVDLDAFGSPAVIAPPPEGQERSEEKR